MTDFDKHYKDVIWEGYSHADALEEVLDIHRDEVFEATLLRVRRELLSSPRSGTLDRDAVADWLARSAEDGDVATWWG